MCGSSSETLTERIDQSLVSLSMVQNKSAPPPESQLILLRLWCDSNNLQRSFLSFILYECICFRCNRGSRDEEHYASWRDKLGQGDVPLSQQSSWLARFSACVCARACMWHNSPTRTMQKRKIKHDISVLGPYCLNTAGFTEITIFCRKLISLLFIHFLAKQNAQNH